MGVHFFENWWAVAQYEVSRDEELQADRLGLLMMAEAGYHPDYVLKLMENFRRHTGDKSKAGTFLLSDHPRWETREKKGQGRLRGGHESLLVALAGRGIVARRRPRIGSSRT